MIRIPRLSRAVGSILALGTLIGCAGEMATSSPPQEAATMAPQLAGAWYQIHFDTNKIDIDTRGRMIVSSVANVIANNSATRATVIGRADRVGPAAANLTLSQRRADQVRDALIAAGVPAARIDTRWTGEMRQQVATGDQVDEARNRVVDITVVQETR